MKFLSTTLGKTRSEVTEKVFELKKDHMVIHIDGQDVVSTHTHVEISWELYSKLIMMLVFESPKIRVEENNEMTLVDDITIDYKHTTLFLNY